MPAVPEVLRLDAPGLQRALGELLGRYALRLAWVGEGGPIPGSYWGETEAGLVADCLYLRPETPLHSALHEACHYLCMDPARRAALDTDAGGDFAEEDAVCYLQILLAGELGVSHEAICADMDAWGYTFRLGSAGAWFRSDADDARTWLAREGLTGPEGRLSYRVRGAPGHAGS